MAFWMTCSVKSLTTLKLTSASSSAVRTSRIDSRIFSSLIFPRPERERKTVENLSVKASNMRRILAGWVACSYHRGHENDLRQPATVVAQRLRLRTVGRSGFFSDPPVGAERGEAETSVGGRTRHREPARLRVHDGGVCDAGHAADVRESWAAGAGLPAGA